MGKAEVKAIKPREFTVHGTAPNGMPFVAAVLANSKEEAVQRAVETVRKHHPEAFHGNGASE